MDAVTARRQRTWNAISTSDHHHRHWFALRPSPGCLRMHVKFFMNFSILSTPPSHRSSSDPFIMVHSIVHATQTVPIFLPKLSLEISRIKMVRGGDEKEKKTRQQMHKMPSWKGMQMHSLNRQLNFFMPSKASLLPIIGKITLAINQIRANPEIELIIEQFWRATATLIELGLRALAAAPYCLPPSLADQLLN